MAFVVLCTCIKDVGWISIDQSAFLFIRRVMVNELRSDRVDIGENDYEPLFMFIMPPYRL